MRGRARSACRYSPKSRRTAPIRPKRAICAIPPRASYHRHCRRTVDPIGRERPELRSDILIAIVDRGVRAIILDQPAAFFGAPGDSDHARARKPRDLDRDRSDRARAPETSTQSLREAADVVHADIRGETCRAKHPQRLFGRRPFRYGTGSESPVRAATA